MRKSIAVHKLIMYTKNPTADTPTANCLKKEVSLGLPKVGKDKEANLLSSTLQNMIEAIKLSYKPNSLEMGFMRNLILLH